MSNISTVDLSNVGTLVNISNNIPNALNCINVDSLYVFTEIFNSNNESGLVFEFSAEDSDEFYNNPCAWISACRLYSDSDRYVISLVLGHMSDYSPSTRGFNNSGTVSKSSYDIDDIDTILRVISEFVQHEFN